MPALSLPDEAAHRWSRPNTVPLALMLFGALALYVPTFFRLATGEWMAEEQAHGPMIFVVSLWLFARRWSTMRERARHDRPSAWGFVLLVPVLLAYVLGRSQDILVLEVGAIVALAPALLLLALGPRALGAQAMALVFMLFMIPLPGQLVDMLTLPMKIAVSNVVEYGLYAAGYPIARNGVMLQIGQFQLLVADACAGLKTLFSLEAFGLLYMSVVKHGSTLRNVVLGLLIVPISFAANVIRVTVLTLITYYLGDAAGQGFLHGFAGMVLFFTALVLIVGADATIRWIARKRHRV